MSRPLLLVSLLLLMMFTSQFEWNQHIVNEVEARPLSLSQKQQYILEREESVKEKDYPKTLPPSARVGFTVKVGVGGSVGNNGRMIESIDKNSGDLAGSQDRIRGFKINKMEQLQQVYTQPGEFCFNP